MERRFSLSRRCLRLLAVLPIVVSTVVAVGRPTPVLACYTSPSRQAAQSCLPAPGSLSQGHYLSPGQYLQSPAGRYELVMQQADGNLVLYDLNNGAPLWATMTDGKRNAYATLQTDGPIQRFSWH
jgi:hypothetical protein